MAKNEIDLRSRGFSKKEKPQREIWFRYRWYGLRLVSIKGFFISLVPMMLAPGIFYLGEKIGVTNPTAYEWLPFAALIATFILVVRHTEWR